MGRRIHRKYKQGTFNPSNPKKYTGTHPIVYRSGLELKMMGWLDKSSNILEWTSESVVVPYIHPKDGRVHRYFLDFSFKMKRDGKLKKYLVEVKPSRQTKPPSNRLSQKSYLYESATYAVNMSKWDAAKQWSKKHGYEFIIITEKHLN